MRGAGTCRHAGDGRCDGLARRWRLCLDPGAAGVSGARCLSAQSPAYSCRIAGPPHRTTRKPKSKVVDLEAGRGSSITRKFNGIALDPHLPALRPPRNRNHAHRRLPVLLRLQGVRRGLAAERWRLLCVLLLRLFTLPADAGSTGEGIGRELLRAASCWVIGTAVDLIVFGTGTAARVAAMRSGADSGTVDVINCSQWREGQPLLGELPVITCALGYIPLAESCPKKKGHPGAVRSGRRGESAGGSLYFEAEVVTRLIRCAIEL